jgi:ribose transport system permease protein
MEGGMTGVVATDRPSLAAAESIWRRHLAMLVLVTVLLGLIVANIVVDSGFLSLGQVRNTLLVTAPLALLAGGQTIAMLTGGIDLSIAMTATAAAYVCGSQAARGAPAWLAITEGLLAAAIVGLINGAAIAVFRINPLIMTLGMAGILTGVLTVGSQSFLRGATGMPELISTLGGGTIFGPIPWNLLVWGALGIGLVLLLKRTGFGRMVYGIGDNRGALRLAGVRVWQVETLVYVVCAVLAGVAGLLLGGRSGSVDLQLSNSYLLPAVAAAVIGGTSILGGVGGYSGTILGALILSVLETLLNRLSVDESIRQVLYGSIVLVLAAIYVRTTRTRGGRQ